VCVLLDGEESELTFVDHPSSEMSVSTSTYFRDATLRYMVMNLLVPLRSEECYKQGNSF